MPVKVSTEIQSQDDEYLPDRNQVVSEYVEAPGGGASITRAVSATIEWSISATFGVAFEAINGSLGGTYSQSKTEGDDYQMTLLPGETARIVYTPKFHVVHGFVTQTEGGDIFPNPTGGTPIPTQVVTTIDHQPATLYFPIAGGVFHLEYDAPMFYTDSRFEGQAIRLPKGDYDWGSIPNDAISSIRVPLNYTVQVFMDTHFQGESRTIGPGDYGYVGDDWNDKISSIKIW